MTYLDPAAERLRVYQSLAEWMETNGVDTRAVAKRLGLTVQAVRAWVRNEAVPGNRREMVNALVRTEFVPEPETEPVRRGPAVKTCYCGKPATKILVFTLTLPTRTRANKSPARLDLCADCWELEQEQERERGRA